MIRVKGQPVGEVKSWDLRSDWLADWKHIETVAGTYDAPMSLATVTMICQALVDLKHMIEKDTTTAKKSAVVSGRFL